MGLKKGERFVIVRFVSRSAVHDIGCGGLALEAKRRAVEERGKWREKAGRMVGEKGDLTTFLVNNVIK